MCDSSTCASGSKYRIIYWQERLQRINGKEEVIIRIELKGKDLKYDSCVLEIEENGIVEIVCPDADKKVDLIELITGIQVTNGVCMLGELNTENCLKDYKRKVDIIELDRIESSLTVRNYLTFYTMVAGVFRNDTLIELTQLFHEMGMEYLLDKALNELDKVEKIKVRCIASYLKRIDCLVGNDILKNLEPMQMEMVLEFLKEYLYKKCKLCLLIESVSTITENVDAMYVI